MIKQLSEDLLWSQIVARAWCDEGFMKRLRSDPRTVLAEHGMAGPEGVDVKVVDGAEVGIDDLDGVRYLTLPASAPDDLCEEDLVASPVAWCYSAGCVACGACGRCACRCAACRCAACRCF
jgi:hypothetical protein